MRPRRVMIQGLAVLACGFAVGCAQWGSQDSTPSASEYTAAAVRRLSNGNVSQAEDMLLRARALFPENEMVLRWSAHVMQMQRQNLEAVDVLLTLSRFEQLETVSLAELRGQIGDLLFAVGRYGESFTYLRAGSFGESRNHRAAKAMIIRAMPYAARSLNYGDGEVELISGPWPEMLCQLGSKTRRCLVDSGSSMSTLTQSLAEEVGVTDIIEFGTVRDSMGREHTARIGALPGLTVGGVDIGPMPIVIVEDERLAIRDPFGGPDNPPEALIGLDVLSRFRVSLDLRQNLATFRRPQGLVALKAESCLFVDGCYLLPIQVDGVRMWFILDTAASHSSLTNAGLRILPGGARRVIPDHRPKANIRQFISRKVSGLVLETSRVKFTNIELPVVERLASGEFPVHGVFGADLLQHCRMTMERGKVLLEQVAKAQRTPRD